MGEEKEERRRRRRMDHDVIDTCVTRACLVHDVTDTHCQKKERKKERKEKRKAVRMAWTCFPAFQNVDL